LVAKFEPDDLAALVMSVVNVGSALTSKDIRG
jgi:hypothetical protein